MENLPNCPKCNSEYTYEDGSLLVCPECAYEWSPEASNEEEKQRKLEEKKRREEERRNKPNWFKSTFDKLSNEIFSDEDMK